MQQLNLISGKTKAEIAIDFIREHEPDEGYFLGFSGGKDSVVLYDLTEKAGVKFKGYYSATGIDPPEVVKFINNYYPTITHKKPKHSFFHYIANTGYGFPTIWHRWCCNQIKKNNTAKIALPHRLLGIRAEESNKRAKRPQIDYFKKLKQFVYKPIFTWLEWEIWDHIERHNLPYCSLYDEGFSRLGCVVCPFLSYRENMRNKNRWPKIHNAFGKAMKKLYIRGKKDGTPWKEDNFNEFLDNWYRGK